jgi:O-antigen/teichoic acid export membrane protein
MSLKKNVLANYLSQAWTTVMGVAFVPLYIEYLGIEAYGLIGIFVLLQTLLGVLDLGLSPSLSREMARFQAGAYDCQSIRDLLRSVEVVFFGLAAVIALTIWGVSGWLATDWLKPDKLPLDVVTRAFGIMGLVIALRFIEGIYRSSIIGLQRQVFLAVITAIIATMRGFGAVAVFVWVSPTIVAFFAWQAIVSIASAGVLMLVFYRSIPASAGGRFSVAALVGIWRFAFGMLGISALSLVLTQLDKILLSKFLSLQQYGRYMLASAVAGVLFAIVSPISQAFYPRFSQLFALGDHDDLVQNYHKAAQFVTILVGSAAFMLIAFGDKALYLWTHDSALAAATAPVLSVLALGTLVNCFLWIPYQMQLAHGIVGLAIKSNVGAILIVVPALLWAIPRYGAIGAAWVWAGFNCGYIVVNVNFMYRRILSGEQWRWYLKDIALPLTAITVLGLALRLGMPDVVGRLANLGILVFTALVLVVGAAFSAPAIRHALVTSIPYRLRALLSRM